MSESSTSATTSTFGNSVSNDRAAGPTSGRSADSFAGGGVVFCPSCETQNATSRKFCGGCGVSLWELCPGCNERNLAAEAFCGSCGMNVAEHVAQLQRELQAAIARAESLRDDHRFDDAIDALSGIAVGQHSNLVKLAAEAERLAAQYLAERDDLAELARRNLEQARASTETGDMVGAWRLLDEIPETLRNQEMLELLERTRESVNEATVLEESIRQRVKEKQLEGLIADVERLLTLRPEKADFNKLRDQLLQRQNAREKQQGAVLLREAQQLLGANQYVEAYGKLSQIARDVRSPEVEKFIEGVAELDWLYRNLRAAPVIDPTVRETAQRLANLRPNDERLQQLRAQLEQRGAARPESGHSPYGAWAKPPERSAVNLPVQWFAIPRRLQPVSDEVGAQLEEHPGRFWPAIGLALQAMGRAAIDTNMRPRSSRGSLLGKLTWSKGAGKTAWGIDVGLSGLKAVQLVADEKSSDLAIGQCVFIATNPTNGRQHWGEILDEMLRAFAEQHDLQQAKVYASLPGTKLLGRFFQLPPLAGSKLEQTVRYEAKLQMPIPLEDLAWDFAQLGADEFGSEPEEKLGVVLVGAKLTELQSYITTFEEASIPVEGIQGDSLALYNALAFELFEPSSDSATPEGRAIAVVDVGANASSVMVFSPTRVWYRNFGHGADDFNRAATAQFKLTNAQAVKLVHRPAAARSLRQVDELFDPIFAKLAHEVTRSLSAFASEFPDVEIDQLLVVGGGARVHGLYRFLRSGSLLES
ncbi:MAG: pilus assembly protein PilM [Planctomycetales bacterium]|nr:pilus assembly protein PilM [Planctomycetales bacterium]